MTAIHVDIDPWAYLCRVTLNGVDISRWLKGADDEANIVVVAWPGLLMAEDRAIHVEGELRIEGVEEARAYYLIGKKPRTIKCDLVLNQ